jgi:hypothetical protein
VVLSWIGILLAVAVVAIVLSSSRTHRPAPPHDQTGTMMTSPSAPDRPDGAPAGPTPAPAPPGAAYPPATPYPGTPYPPATSYGAAPYPAPQPYPAPAAPPASYPGETAAPGPAAYLPPAATSPGAPTPAWEPPPARPRPEGPGPVTVGVVLALCLFAGAGVLLAERAGVFTGSAALTAAGVALALLGLGVLISGVRGRRSGALGALALLVALLAVPAAWLTTAAPTWTRIVTSGGDVVAGDVVWIPTTAAAAAEGYSFGVGEARIDLTRVPLGEAGATPVSVPIEVGAGSTTVVVPTGQPVEVRTHLGAGEISTVLVGDWTRDVAAGPGTRVESPTPGPTPSGTTERVSRTELSGTNLDLTLRSPTAGPTELVVTIDAGLGEVNIEESF